jgi:hypothetical protein
MIFMSVSAGAAASLPIAPLSFTCSHQDARVTVLCVPAHTRDCLIRGRLTVLNILTVFYLFHACP